MPASSQRQAKEAGADAVPPYHPPTKHSVRIIGHRTSISLEPVFWDALKRAARGRGVALSALVAQIDRERLETDTPPGLASAIRLWLWTNERGGTP